MTARTAKVVWIVTVPAVSIAGALLATRLRFAGLGSIHQFAWSCAALSFFWSLWAAVADWGWNRRQANAGVSSLVAVIGRPAALLLGVAASIVASVILVMRIIVVTVHVVHSEPWSGTRDYGFGPFGLETLGFLFASCAV